VLEIEAHRELVLGDLGLIATVTPMLTSILPRFSIVKPHENGVLVQEYGGNTLTVKSGAHDTRPHPQGWPCNAARLFLIKAHMSGIS
jgi:hypothetical protein